MRRYHILAIMLLGFILVSGMTLCNSEETDLTTTKNDYVDIPKTSATEAWRQIVIEATDDVQSQWSGTTPVWSTINAMANNRFVDAAAGIKNDQCNFEDIGDVDDIEREGCIVWIYVDCYIMAEDTAFQSVKIQECSGSSGVDTNEHQLSLITGIADWYGYNYTCDPHTTNIDDFRLRWIGTNTAGEAYLFHYQTVITLGLNYSIPDGLPSRHSEHKRDLYKDAFNDLDTIITRIVNAIISFFVSIFMSFKEWFLDYKEIIIGAIGVLAAILYAYFRIAGARRKVETINLDYFRKIIRNMRNKFKPGKVRNKN